MRRGSTQFRPESPKPLFKVLLVTEPSRLGRDTIRTLGVVQELEEAGVEVWATAGARRIEHDDIGAIVESRLNDQEREKGIERVNRALSSRFERTSSPAVSATAMTWSASPAWTRP